MKRQPLRRRSLARLLALPALAALLYGAWAGLIWFDNAANRGITYTPAPQPIPWTDLPPLGVNLYNIQFEPDPARVTRTLELTRDMGARFVRLQMPWEDVEISAKGDFWDHKFNQSAWAKYDSIISQTVALGLEPIVRIDRPPRWARAQADATPEFQRGLRENGDSTGPPDRYADYGDFVGVVAERYRGQVRFIQLWNEPNLAYEWNWLRPQPERFVELLQAGYTAAKVANPAVQILFPSLSPTDGLEPRIAPMTELEYLDRVYAAGGAEYFDIMSAQGYGLGQPPDEHRYVFPRRPGNWVWSRPIDTRIDVSRLVLLREVMLRHGDSATAVWVSEFGYNSAPEQLAGVDAAHWASERNKWGPPVSEQQKGTYLIGQLERARREWPWVGVMTVWFLRWGGEAPNPANPTQYFALVEHDFTPLPAYDQLRDYQSRPAVADVGAHAWQHPAVQARSDGWELRFTGDWLALAGSGTVRITLDGGPPRELTLTGADTPLRVAEGLGAGQHTLLLRAAQPPAVFVVGRNPSLPWFWLGAPAVLLVLLALLGAQCGAALVGRRPRRPANVVYLESDTA